MNKTNNQNSENLNSGQTLSRKEALDKISAAAKKLAVALTPFLAVAAFTEKAHAQFRKLDIVRILNILLQMEFMLELFYLIAVLNDDLIPDTYQRSIDTIKVHHQNHVLYLKSIIRRLKTQTNPAPQISCNFNTDNLNPKNSFDDFLQIAQVLEDASTSLYKKYTPKLRELGFNEILLRDMLRTHTAEARHAAYIRLIRNKRGLQELSPWISSTANNAVLPPMQEIYINEDNVKQHEIQVPSVTSVPLPVVREAWDEPCDGEPINRLFKLFNARF